MANENRSIRDKLSEEVTEGFQRSTSVIAGHTREVLGDALGSLMDDIKGLASGMLGMMKGTMSALTGGLFGSTEQKSLNEQEDQTTILQSMLGIFKRREKREAVSFDQDQKGMTMTILGMVSAAIGIAIGAIIRKIILPFEMVYRSLMGIWKAIKSSKVITSITSGFGKIGEFFSSIFTYIKSTKIFGVIKKAFTFFKELFEPVFRVIKRSLGFVKELPIVSDFLGGLAKGFGKAFIVLQALMSVIDFVQGWMSTEGSIIDKIKGGLIRVVHDFIELPVKLLGGITDWILGLFGVEIEGGSAQKIMDGIMKTVIFTIDAVMGPFEQIGGAISWLWSSISSIMTDFDVFDKIKDLFSIVLDALLSPFKAAGEGLKFLGNIVTGDGSGAIKNLENIGSIITDLGDKIWDFIKRLVPSGEQIKTGIGEFGSFLKDIFIDPIVGLVNKVKEFFANLLPSWDTIVSAIKSKIPPGTPDGLLPDFLEKGKKQVGGKAKGIDDLEKSGYFADDWGKNTLNTDKLRKGLSSGDISRKDLNTLRKEANLDYSGTKQLNKLMAQMSDENKKAREETKKQNEKTIKAIKEGQKSTDQVNNTIVNQQNTTTGKSSDIPEENEHVGMGILNGAMI